MNVYDCANELAKALKESHEFKKLQEARVVLKKDAQAEELANDFIKLSSEIELAKYQKQEVDKEKVQKLSSLLSLNPTAMEYLHAFMRFQMMMADITKTINDVVKEAVGE
jgi:cell fate (sporulation/competence/biofilm development) regulator YlbF (YheA/YmcA/DUF963 family)